MNPLTNMRNVLKLSENDLKNGSKSSWHDEYKDSAWIFVGGLPYDLSEGDIICVFSQYGEIVNINLVRDKLTGKQKGFCFICFEDQRSTILSVDNLNGIKILGKTLRVDHVKDYKPPKDDDKMDEETKRLQMEGCAPKPQLPADQIKKEFIEPKSEVVGGVRLPMRLPIGKIEIKRESDIKEEITHKAKSKKEKKSKKGKKEKKSKKKRRTSTSSSDDSTGTSSESEGEGEKKKKRRD